MKVTVVCVGKLKEKYWRDAIAEYSKRLSRYMKLEIIELADEKAPENMSDAQAGGGQGKGRTADSEKREGRCLCGGVGGGREETFLRGVGRIHGEKERWRRESHGFHHRRLSGAFPCGDAAGGFCTQLFQNDISAPDDACGFIGADLPLGADSAQRAIS